MAEWGWLHILAEYELSVEYRAGTSNKAADYLSRKPSGKVLVEEEGDLVNTIGVPLHDIVVPQRLEESLAIVIRYLLGLRCLEQSWDSHTAMEARSERRLRLSHCQLNPLLHCPVGLRAVVRRHDGANSGNFVFLNKTV